MENIPNSAHDLKILDRSQIIMSGIKRIISFDHEEFLIESALGTLLLKGEGLELLKMDTHDGNVSIKGKINSIAYSDAKKQDGESFLNKLFK